MEHRRKAFATGKLTNLEKNLALSRMSATENISQIRFIVIDSRNLELADQDSSVG